MASPVQPTLPVEKPLTPAERQQILETPSIFPKNQDSNWGYRRKVFSDQIQGIINQQSLMYAERFVDSAEQFLDELEYQVGLPMAPAGVSLFDRRLRVKARLQTGVFTKQRVIDLIEPYILATFGSAPRFSLAGLSLVGGIILQADASGDPKQYYRIYWSPETFTYVVRIVSSVTPDTTSLLRDLKFITPSHMDVTLDNSLANIIDYSKEIRNLDPVAYYKLSGNVNDSSGSGPNGTLAGGSHDPAAIAAPGLLNSNVGSGNADMDFDGTDDYFSISVGTTALAIKNGELSAEVIIRPDALANSTTYQILYSTHIQLYVQVDSSGKAKLQGMLGINGASTFTSNAPAATEFVVGTTYSVGISFDKQDIKLWKDGVVIYTLHNPGEADSWANDTIRVGAVGAGTSNFWNGGMGELAFYSYPLEDQFLKNNKSRQNILI